MERLQTGNREEWLRSICPRIEDENWQAIELDDFHQNALLPILAFQNEIILAQFRKYLRKFKPAFNAYNQNIQKNYISDVMKTDPRIKNSLIATIVSVMTLDEYDYYCENKSSVNPQIVDIVIKTLYQHLEMLY